MPQILEIILEGNDKILIYSSLVKAKVPRLYMTKDWTTFLSISFKLGSIRRNILLAQQKTGGPSNSQNWT